MTDSLKISLKKAIKSLVHVLISGVATAATTILVAWFQNPENMKDVIASAPQWVVGLWMILHPMLVTALDQYKHRAK